MVEEARDIRDRGYLAINLLLGGIAVAVGLFDMFILHTFTAASMFDAFLGMSMITIGILFIAPYMAPRALGLPGPGTRMVRRPYLPYPAPIPEGYGESSSEGLPLEEDVALPRRVPRSSEGLVGRGRNTGTAARYESRPKEAPPLPAWRTSTTTETQAVLSELENLGVHEGPTATYRPGPAPSPLTPIPDMPVRAEHPPPAEYLEEDVPELNPELEPQLRAALADLAGAATGVEVGRAPLKLLNGKPPADTLSDMEAALRAPPPSMAAPETSPRRDEVPGPSHSTPDVSTQGVEAMAAEIDGIDAPVLEHTPPVAEIPGAASVAEELQVVPAANVEGEVAGPASELETESPTPSPEVLEVEPAETSSATAPSDQSPPITEVAPLPQVGTGLAQASAGAGPVVGSPAEEPELPADLDKLPTVEQAQGTPEGRLDEMAKTLDGMLTSIRPLAKGLSQPSSPTPRVPASGQAPSGDANEGYVEEDEPEPGMEELERQLAALRSVLAIDPPAGKPSARPSPNKPKPSPPTTPLTPKVTSASPSPPEQTTEDDLQKILDQARSALTLTEERHEGVRKRAKEQGH